MGTKNQSHPHRAHTGSLGDLPVGLPFPMTLLISQASLSRLFAVPYTLASVEVVVQVVSRWAQ